MEQNEFRSSVFALMCLSTLAAFILASYFVVRKVQNDGRIAGDTARIADALENRPKPILVSAKTEDPVIGTCR